MKILEKDLDKLFLQYNQFNIAALALKALSMDHEMFSKYFELPED